MAEDSNAGVTGALAGAVAALVVAGVAWLALRKKPAQDAPTAAGPPELVPEPSTSTPAAAQASAPSQATPAAASPAASEAAKPPAPEAPIILDFSYSPPSTPVPRKGE